MGHALDQSHSFQLWERTITMRSDGDHRGKINDFLDSFESIKLMYLLLSVW